ncbi:sensor histidine kinase [Luteipulveratus flavus]|uniref:Histidine kinase n=1 Tax=Luteipulveratus flavus TaxID=3031728 RepID=A0ABT6C3F4_9MICO|nr:histidine kinase [Luteipulveratus sp. YIM 133296]MDF8263392.1 histidine kinase [Luteipulveratus sp. YIM 133296]
MSATDRRPAWFATVPDDADAAAPEGEERGMSGLVVSALFAGVWLVFLATPIATAWRMPNHVRGAAGVALTIAFGAVYLLHFNAARTASFGARPSGEVNRLRHLAWYALLALTALACTLVVGQDGTATWVFLAVAGCWTFRLWIALAVGVGLIVAYELLAWLYTGWERDASLGGSILLAMIAVSGAMLAARRQRALVEVRRENARLAVQDERNRMARDLHDILGHSLTVITVKAELAGRLLDADPVRARAEVADLERLSRDALSDVRRAVEGYREISLAGELARAREVLAAAGIRAEVPRATDEVSTDLREMFAWTVREAITNILRHSRAQECTITLTPTSVTVTDDGRGAQGSSGGGNGLRGLRERATAAGAVLVTRQREPSGFELTVAASGTPTTSRTTRETTQA